MKKIFVCLGLGLLISGFTGCCREPIESEEQAKQVVELEFYTWIDEEIYMKELVDAYMKENPEIVVNLHVSPVDEYSQTLQICLNGERKVDVFALSKPSLGIIYQEKQLVLDLNPYMKRLDTSGYGNWFKELNHGNKMTMLPYRMSPWVVYYNKRIFDESGVKYPQEGWTWEDYTEIARRLTKQYPDGNKVYGSMSFDLSGNWWRVPARTTGKENPLDNEGMEQMKKAAKWNYDMSYIYQAQQKYTDFTGSESYDYIRKFLRNDVGMFFNGDWCLPMLNRTIMEENLDFSYDVAPLPYWPGEESYGLASAAVLQVAKKTEHPEEALDFLAFVCGGKGASILAQRSMIPAWDTEEIQEIFRNSLSMPEHIQYFFIHDKISQVPESYEYEEAMDIVRRYVNQYLLQEISLDQAFEKCEEEIRAKELIK